MSVFNNKEDTSLQFQILVPEEEGRPLIGSALVQIDNQNSEEQSELSGNIGVIIDQDTIIIIDRKESLKICSQNQWQNFIFRYQKAFARKMDEVQVDLTIQHPILNYTEMNTIILMQAEDMFKRKMFFSVANTYANIQQQFINRYQEEQNQNKENMLTVLSFDFSEQDLSDFKRNLMKIHKIIKKICSEYENNCDAIRLRQHQKQIMQWIYDTLIRYAIEDQQVRYCKGLQYICLGIVVAYPQFNIPKYSQIFQHFMHVNQFRELYLEGSPRFFRELAKIQDQIRESHQQIYSQIESREGDFKNLFITYFRSCLIYRMSDPNVIRKIFELLLVEGIPIMRTIILRILSKKQDQILTQKQFLEFISSRLVTHYFKESDRNEMSASYRLQRLFIV